MGLRKKTNKEVSEKAIYFWNIAGSLCNATISVLLLIVVTRILGKEDGDIFSLAWAISQLMLTVATFQVRLYQATDISEIYKFRQYLVFRIITSVAMLIFSIFYIKVKHYGGDKALIIMTLCVNKAIDAMTDVYQGWFQQKERLDLAGKSLAMRSVSSLFVFLVMLLTTKNLFAGCMGMNVASVVCFFAFELRYRGQMNESRPTERAHGFKWIWNLTYTCLPLFINAFLVMSIFNAPKMAIDSATESGILSGGSQTIYGILFMPASVINLAYIVFRPVITQMAVAWHNQKAGEYVKLVLKISLGLVVISLVIMAGGWLLGIPVLSILYNIDLRDYKAALLILLLGGGLNTLVNVLDNALTVIRKQYTLVIAYVLTWIYSIIVSPVIVEKMQILGASFSFMTSMLLLLVIVFIIFVVSVKKEVKKFDV